MRKRFVLLAVAALLLSWTLLPRQRQAATPAVRAEHAEPLPPPAPEPPAPLRPGRSGLRPQAIRPPDPWFFLVIEKLAVLLTEDEPIVGRVVDEAGRPIAQAAVGIAPLDGFYAHRFQFHPRTFPFVRSNLDGSFSLEDLSGSPPYFVWASAKGYAEGRRLDLYPGQRDVVIRLRKGAVVRGTVLDDRGPVSESLVRILPSVMSGRTLVATALDLPLPDATAGRTGEFEATNLRGGVYDILVSTPDGRAGKLGGLSLRDGEERSGLRIYVRDGGRLTGRVLDASSGSPISGGRVFSEYTERIRGRTQKDGTFEISGVAPGPADVMITSAEGHVAAWVYFLGEPGQTVDLGTLRLSKPTFRGTEPLGSTGLDVYTLGGVTRVLNCLDGSPAQLAGIQIGDELVAIDGLNMSGLAGVFTVNNFLYGPAGSEVTVTLQAADHRERYTVRLVRQQRSDWL